MYQDWMEKIPVLGNIEANTPPVLDDVDKK